MEPTTSPAVVAAVGREIWLTEYKSKNPNADVEECRSKWQEVSSAYLSIVRKAFRRLEKRKIFIQSRE